MNEKDPSTESSQMMTYKEAEMVKEPEADDNKGPTKKDPNNIV